MIRGEPSAGHVPAIQTSLPSNKAFSFAFLGVFCIGISQTISVITLREASTLELVCLIHVMTVLFLGLWLLRCPNRRSYLILLVDKSNARDLFFLCASFLLYDLCFYGALKYGPPVQAVLLSSIWPVMAAVWSRWLKPEWEKPTPYAWGLLVLACCGGGVMLIDQSSTRLAVGYFAVFPALLAIAAAVFGGLWDLLLIRIRERTSSLAVGKQKEVNESFDLTVESRTGIADVLSILFLCRLFVLPFILLVAWMEATPLVPNHALYAAGIVLIGYICGDTLVNWAYSIKTNPTIGSMVFLAPAISSFLLVLLLGLHLGTLSAIGFALVVAGNYLLHPVLKQISIPSYVIGLLTTGAVFCLIFPPIEEPVVKAETVTHFMTLLTVLVGFAFTGGFTANLEISKQLARINSTLGLICCELRVTNAKNLIERLLHLFRRIIDLHYASARSERENLSKEVRESLSTLRQDLQAHAANVRVTDNTKLQEAIFQFDDAVETWLGLRGGWVTDSRVGLFQWMAVLLSGMVVWSRSMGFVAELQAIGGFVLANVLWLMIRNYYDPVSSIDCEELLTAQGVLADNGSKLYLPRAAIAAGKLPTVHGAAKILCFQETPNGKRIEHVLYPDDRLLKIFCLSLWLLCFGLCLARIWSR